jgi:hypothetical protein
MIMAVSLRVVYLIFDRLLDWLLLLGRTSSSKDVELLVLRHDKPIAQDTGRHDQSRDRQTATSWTFRTRDRSTSLVVDAYVGVRGTVREHQS